MANKEIHYMSDNGVMFWPATTTTAIIDPTSREILSDILNKKVSVGIAGNIPSTVLPPIILESITTNSTSIASTATQSGKTYFCPDLGKIRYYYSIEVSQNTVQVVPENTDPSPELIYYDKETDKFYRWNTTTQGMVNIFLDEELTFIDVDLADLDTNIVSSNLTEYYLYSTDEPFPASTFIGEDGKYKRVAVRIRVLEEDNPEGMSYENIDEDYWNFSIKLVPIMNSSSENIWNFSEVYFFGSYIYNGTVYSAAINQLSENTYGITIRKIELNTLGNITNLAAYEDVPIYPTVGDDLNIAFGKINRIVQSHEEVTARALLDLNNRIQNISGNEGGIQEITWSTLKALRDGGNLNPGSLYRITDYTCTTTQTDTQSAGHVFDIIVLALSESILSEKAWADHHEGDTYFEDCKLEAWELKYCLDNDTTRFTWADTTNGKGIIYYMKDEWENECPYDFKNIQFKRELTDGELDLDNGVNTWVYTFNWWDTTNSVCKDGVITLNGTQYTAYGNSGIIAPIRNNYIQNKSKQTLPFVNYNNILNNIVWLLYGDVPECCNHSIKTGCNNLTLSSGSNNIFEGNNFDIVLTGSATNNIFSSSCSSISLKNCFDSFFGNSCAHITSSVQVIRSIIIEPSNKFITLNSPQSNVIQNVRIALGVNNTISVKTINHIQNSSIQTVYKPANSVEISV